jgi:hypothetical protein
LYHSFIHWCIIILLIFIIIIIIIIIRLIWQKNMKQYGK